MIGEMRQFANILTRTALYWKMGEKMISKKTINITNIIIYIILITVYELLYCNVSFIVGETDYNLSVFRLIVYILLFFFIIKFIFEHTKQEKDKGKFYVLFYYLKI